MGEDLSVTSTRTVGAPMRAPLPSPRRIAAGAGLALFVAGLTPLAASANPAGDGLVISEVYGGGGNTGAPFRNDFIELYNPTNAPVPLAGHVVEYFSGGGGTGGTTTLTGSVPAHGHYLIQEAAGASTTAPLLPAPDATGTLTMSGTSGSVELRNGSTVLDLVGYGTAARREGTATAALSNSTSASRNAARVDTDNNSADFTVGAPAPQNTSDVDGNAPSIAPVPNKVTTSGRPITPFTVTASGGTPPYSWSASGLPAGLRIDRGTGEVTGTPTIPGVYDVTVTAKDAADATGTATFKITVNMAGTVPIAQIQGSAATSPLEGTTVTTRGIVTASYPTGGFFGFYIQTPGSGAADLDLATHTASDAVFVRQTTGSVTAKPGDYVQVTGTVTEFAGATQVEVVPTGITMLSESVAPIVTTTTATWPRAAAQKESLEGMRY
ncbi:MAG TPA: putative Ig domain-containing protein, partial [Propionibacteriaceae bacterium]|nr:putative Ig domain-containing protein [Propionibacteriaceae bacterium]